MLLGLILLIVTGASWVVIGAVVGSAGRAGISVGLLQALSSMVSILVGVGVLGCVPPRGCSATAVLLVGGSVFVSGFINYFVLVLMGKAMKTGPNGVVWAVVQSALIFPFLVGVLFFGTALTGLRGFGIAAILIALFFFALSKDNTMRGDSGSWRKAMIASFLLAGLNQNFSVLPSYFPEAVQVGSVIRSVASSLGTFAAFVMMEGRLFRDPAFLKQFRMAKVWKYVGIQSFMGIVTGYFLMYRGFDALAEVKLGAIGYPVLVSACLVSFTLYSRLLLKERLSSRQWFGLAAGMIGIICISIR